MALSSLLQRLREPLTHYLESQRDKWAELPDGTPLEQVYVLLQAQEHRRPFYREAEAPLPRRPRGLPGEAPFDESLPEADGEALEALREAQ